MDRLLFFDTETTGIPANYDAPVSDSDNWPRLVQFGYILSDTEQKVIESSSFLIKPYGFTIPSEATAIHGISTSKALSEGITIEEALVRIQRLLYEVDTLVGHNVEFDIKVVDAEFYRYGKYTLMSQKEAICTMKSTPEWYRLPNNKYPKLTELYKCLFGKEYENAHDAMSDVWATFKCFWSLWYSDVTLEKVKINKTETTKFAPLEKLMSSLSGEVLPPECARIELPFKHMTEFQKIMLTLSLTSDDTRIRLTNEEKIIYSGTGHRKPNGNSVWRQTEVSPIDGHISNFIIFKECSCTNPTHFQWFKFMIFRVTNRSALPLVYTYFPRHEIREYMKIPLSCEERILYGGQAPIITKKGGIMKWRLSARIADDLECRIEILKYPQCDNPTHIKLSWVDRERKQLRFVLEHNSDEPANDLPPDDLPF